MDRHRSLFEEASGTRFSPSIFVARKQKAGPRSTIILPLARRLDETLHHGRVRHQLPMRCRPEYGIFLRHVHESFEHDGVSLCIHTALFAMTKLASERATFTTAETAAGFAILVLLPHSLSTHHACATPTPHREEFVPWDASGSSSSSKL
eukprot:scaffold1466_cov159-Amphora_coffeaeformis.AAC.1